jgi:hypothetical protein
MVWNLDWLMRYVLLMLRSDIYLKKQEPEMAKKPFSFAHLLGRGASASEEEEDKKAKKRKPVALKKTSVTMMRKTMTAMTTRKKKTRR